jgi:hypothetical protein
MNGFMAAIAGTANAAMITTAIAITNFFIGMYNPLGCVLDFL